jgi:hypothetical protein
VQAYNATANNKAIEGDIEAIKTYKKIQNDIDDQEALISLITPDQKLVYPFSVLKMNNNLTDLKDQLKNLTKIQILVLIIIKTSHDGGNGESINYAIIFANVPASAARFSSDTGSAL